MYLGPPRMRSRLPCRASRAERSSLHVSGHSRRKLLENIVWQSLKPSATARSWSYA
jgi:hypothetical protein